MIMQNEDQMAHTVRRSLEWVRIYCFRMRNGKLYHVIAHHGMKVRLQGARPVFTLTFRPADVHTLYGRNARPRF